MPSSWSSSLRFELQFTGENINLWGDKLNATLARVDDAIAGYVALPITGDYALQAANNNATADEARRAHLKLTGAPAAAFKVTIPALSKSYWVWNATGRIATVTTGGGASVSIDPGDRAPLWCDGANVHTINFGGLDLKPFIAASALAATGTLPGLAGNGGKYLYTDGANALWRQPSTADLTDYNAKVLGVQVALAVAL
jgi:hypothetical protein